MAIRKVVQVGDDVLRKKCFEVTSFDEKLWMLLDDLKDTVKKEEGAGLAAPQAWLLARRAEWRDELDRQLPDALDLMAICISAGSSFEGALAAVGTRMDGAIAAAFARVAKEASYSSRSEALLGLAERAQVNSITFFAASLVQAERAGSSLVDIIRMQAQSVRTERRLKVDDITNKLSTKMLFPMLLLMLPSIIMLMLAPMILQLGEFF